MACSAFPPSSTHAYVATVYENRSDVRTPRTTRWPSRNRCRIGRSCGAGAAGCWLWETE